MELRHGGRRHGHPPRRRAGQLREPRTALGAGTGGGGAAAASRASGHLAAAHERLSGARPALTTAPRPSSGSSGRTLRQLVDDADLAWVLVRRHLLFAVDDHLVRRRTRSRLERYKGHDLFAEPLVRAADDGGLGDGGVGVEDLLDLARVDVVAAADDQILLPVDDEQEVLVVLIAQVAGVEPAAAERLLGLRRLLVVPLGDVVPAQ